MDGTLGRCCSLVKRLMIYFLVLGHISRVIEFLSSSLYILQPDMQWFNIAEWAISNCCDLETHQIPCLYHLQEFTWSSWKTRGTLFKLTLEKGKGPAYLGALPHCLVMLLRLPFPTGVFRWLFLVLLLSSHSSAFPASLLPFLIHHFSIKLLFPTHISYFWEIYHFLFTLCFFSIWQHIVKTLYIFWRTYFFFSWVILDYFNDLSVGFPPAA